MKNRSIKTKWTWAKDPGQNEKFTSPHNRENNGKCGRAIIHSEYFGSVPRMRATNASWIYFSVTFAMIHVHLQWEPISKWTTFRVHRKQVNIEMHFGKEDCSCSPPTPQLHLLFLSVSWSLSLVASHFCPNEYPLNFPLTILYSIRLFNNITLHFTICTLVYLCKHSEVKWWNF